MGLTLTEIADGFYAVQMGEDALSEEPNADSWAGWWDDRVDDPLMKFTVALPNGSQD